MSTLKGKTLFITGASRGIGLAIALRAARDGANIAIAAKSAEPHPKLPGTIHEAARAVEAAGGRALALKCDIREEDQVHAAVAATVDAFGGIDILVNNASAIWLRGALDTPMKRFDLMQQVNARGSFLCAQACLPHLLQAPNPHILTLCPPPSLEPKWWGPHTGYTLAKMGMSFVTLGLAAEFGPRGVAVNALWPRTVIATDAINMIPGVDAAGCRRPEIMADAAHAVLVREAAGFSGQFLIDDEVLAQAGGWHDKNVRMLFIASTLMWTCNTMYIIDMPLWISSDLGLPDKLAGILMGTAAGLEIPAMILAGYYVKRFGKRKMMVVAVAAGVLFYLGLIFFHSREALLALQLFNAIFIGIVAGIGMLWFQDLMPGRAGSATTLFTNSISTGVILAGVIQGALAQSYGHASVYWMIAAISVITFGLTCRVKDV